MEQFTTYRAEGREIGLVFLFKYDLKGNLKAFEIDDGVLDDTQMCWLYSHRFPANEKLMVANWVDNPKVKKVFKITMSPADLSFTVFWELYGLKRKKELSEKAYNKLSEANKIKCFNALREYNKELAFTGQSKAHLVTWINQKRYNDEY